MDISTNAAINSVISAQQASTQSKVAYTVAGKALDAHRAQGDAAVALIESAGQIGKANGKGQHFDAVR